MLKEFFLLYCGIWIIHFVVRTSFASLTENVYNFLFMTWFLSVAVHAHPFTYVTNRYFLCLYRMWFANFTTWQLTCLRSTSLYVFFPSMLNSFVNLLKGDWIPLDVHVNIVWMSQCSYCHVTCLRTKVLYKVARNP